MTIVKLHGGSEMDRAIAAFDDEGAKLDTVSVRTLLEQIARAGDQRMTELIRRLDEVNRNVADLRDEMKADREQLQGLKTFVALEQQTVERVRKDMDRFATSMRRELSEHKDSSRDLWTTIGAAVPGLIALAGVLYSVLK